MQVPFPGPHHPVVLFWYISLFNLVLMQRGNKSAHHLDVDGEAAALLGDGILQSPTDGVRTQGKLGLDGHQGGVGLFHSGSHGAGRVLAGGAVQGEQGQLHVLALGPAQAGHQGVGIEVRRVVEAHFTVVLPADIASRIAEGLRTRRDSHLLDRTGVHAIRTWFEVDHLGGSGCRDQDNGDCRTTFFEFF